jgi:hypothetical protein
VTLHRILIGLLQPLLALLLMVGVAQAEPAVSKDDSRVHAIENSLKVLSVSKNRTNGLELQAQVYLGEDNSDNGSEPVLLLPETGAILDQAYLIRTSRVAYPTAPPSHRPCASLPTGPPLV